ncbi:MAG: hypothetical protein V4857_02510 [Pseudomonadota bacterium]
MDQSLPFSMSSESLFITCSSCGAAVHRNAQVCACGVKAKRIRPLWKWLVGGGLAIVIINILAPTSTPQPQADPATEVTLAYDWRAKAGGMVMEADFTIKNETANAIKDVQILCTHFSKSKTRIDSNATTIYQVIAPQENHIARNVNMGFIHTQAVTTSCRVKKFSRA